MVFKSWLCIRLGETEIKYSLQFIFLYWITIQFFANWTASYYWKLHIHELVKMFVTLRYYQLLSDITD